MRISGVLSMTLVNGEGIRYVVFTQGCKHYCKGCHNPDTWDFNGGEEITVEALAEQIKSKIDKKYDGITLSGGDPYYQEEECLKLLDLLPNINVWIYTGFEWDEIKDRELTKRADVVVVGKFVEELKCDGEMYGSTNQRIVRLK